MKKPVAETSEVGCGPSSSNGQNGSEKKFGTACLILDDSEDDSDDDMFEYPPKNDRTDDESEERLVHFCY